MKRYGYRPQPDGSWKLVEMDNGHLVMHEDAQAEIDKLTRLLEERTELLAKRTKTIQRIMMGRRGWKSGKKS